MISSRNGCQIDRASASAGERYNRLDAARHDSPPFVNSPDWLRLPLAGYPDFSKGRPELFPDSLIRARDVLPGENWTFPDHRTLADVIEAERTSARVLSKAS